MASKRKVKRKKKTTRNPKNVEDSIPKHNVCEVSSTQEESVDRLVENNHSVSKISQNELSVPTVQPESTVTEMDICDDSYPKINIPETDIQSNGNTMEQDNSNSEGIQQIYNEHPNKHLQCESANSFSMDGYASDIVPASIAGDNSNSEFPYCSLNSAPTSKRVDFRQLFKKSCNNYESETDEYVPTTGSSTDSSDDEIPKLEVRRKRSKCSNSESNRQASMVRRKRKPTTETICDSTVNESELERTNSPAKAKLNSEEGVVVNTAPHSSFRIQNKKNYCAYCLKPLSKVTRHLEKCHSDEKDVAKAASYPKGSAKRRLAFELILRSGNYFHNLDVLVGKQGELCVLRRPSEVEAISSKVSDYGPCPGCLGFLHKKYLWHHFRHCPFKQLNVSEQEMDKRQQMQMESTALLPVLYNRHNLSSGFQKVLESFRKDDISSIAIKDNLIRNFGCLLFEKYGAHQNDLIRQNMRQLARFLIKVQEITNSEITLSDLISPKRFDLIIQSVIEITKFKTDNGCQISEIPSLALKLGYHLNKCASILKGGALRERNSALIEEIDAFKSLYDLEWECRISVHALQSLHSRKQNSVEILPLTSDLLKLNKFLKRKIESLEELLQENPSDIESWHHLSQFALARIILFSKRRGGEMSKMLLLDYLKRPNWMESCTEETQATLTPFEKKLCSKMTLYQIRGKRGRIVPVLLTPDMVKSIDILNSTRLNVGINPENPYVFARAYGNSVNSLRGNDCLRAAAHEAGVSNAGAITSTNLRKYVSTVTQVCNLTETETDWLARHLGHDARIHREFYRLHESTVELAKVSRLLQMVDEGKAHKFIGKKLSEINIEDFPDPADESEATEKEMDTGTLDEEENQAEMDSSKDLPTSNNVVQHGTVTSMGCFSTPVSEECHNNSKQKTHSINQISYQSVKSPKMWKPQEKMAIISFFKKHISENSVPNKVWSLKCLSAHSQLLHGKTWKEIKNVVYTQIAKIRKNKKKHFQGHLNA